MGSIIDYPWSSYHHHSGGKISWLIQDHHLFKALGETREERCNAYNESFRYRFDRRLVNFIADTVNMGQILGGDAFKDTIEKIANHRVRPLKRGRLCKTLVTLRLLMVVVPKAG